MLTAEDETTIARIVAREIVAAVPPIVEKAINRAFATHPRLARMEKRDGRIQRDINYLVDAVDAIDLRQRQDGKIIKDHELRLHRLENPS